MVIFNSYVRHNRRVAGGTKALLPEPFKKSAEPRHISSTLALTASTAPTGSVAVGLKANRSPQDDAHGFRTIPRCYKGTIRL